MSVLHLLTVFEQIARMHGWAIHYHVSYAGWEYWVQPRGMYWGIGRWHGHLHQWQGYRS